jgi:hypothetical protein
VHWRWLLKAVCAARPASLAKNGVPVPAMRCACYPKPLLQISRLAQLVGAHGDHAIPVNMASLVDRMCAALGTSLTTNETVCVYIIWNTIPPCYTSAALTPASLHPRLRPRPRGRLQVMWKRYPRPRGLASPSLYDLEARLTAANDALDVFACSPRDGAFLLDAAEMACANGRAQCSPCHWLREVHVLAETMLTSNGF